MIKKVLSEGRVPVKIWSDDVEAEAIQQLINTSNLPFVYKHVAAMPDVHFGKGATVGSVIATDKAICPAAVGVDIGCGMMAVKIKLDAKLAQDEAKEIRHSIERSIPVGSNSNKDLTQTVLDWTGWDTHPTSVDMGVINRAMNQLGSLGGGNHFIELCTDTESNLWVVLHSGSRNIGKQVAEFHINKAKKIMERYFISLTDPDLAYLSQGTEEFKHYIGEVEWCQSFAFENRKEMMRRILKDLAHVINNAEPIEVLTEINCHHNYLARENHFGQNVIVTRKGAVRARSGDMGIIPGSMGTRSYIVEGLGNEDSFCSCSHGAGRRMSRNQARKTFTKEDLEKQTEGVECRKDLGVLDEIPGAYKDIDVVMENQKDLVKIVATLKQFMCVKG